MLFPLSYRLWRPFTSGQTCGGSDVALTAAGTAQASFGSAQDSSDGVPDTAAAALVSSLTGRTHAGAVA